MTHPTQEDDVKAIRDALADHSFLQDGEPVYDCCKFFKAANPARIARLLARLEQAERDAGRYQFDCMTYSRQAYDEDGTRLVDGVWYWQRDGKTKTEQDALFDAAIASEAKT